MGFCCPHSCLGVRWSSMALLTWPGIDSSAGDDLAPSLSSSGSFIWWFQGCRKSERGKFQYTSNFQAFTCPSLANVTLVKASHIAQGLVVREPHKGMGPGRAKILSIFEGKKNATTVISNCVCFCLSIEERSERRKDLEWEGSHRKDDLGEHHVKLFVSLL